MAIEVRMRVPGATRWTISSFEEVLDRHGHYMGKSGVNIFTDTQAEADMINGYALIHSSANKAKVKPEIVLDSDTPWIRAQVVQVSPLS